MYSVNILLGVATLTFITGLLMGLFLAFLRHKSTQGMLHQQIGSLSASLEAEKELSRVKMASLENAKQSLRDEMNVLSQKILEEKSLKFTQVNATQLGSILNPLKQQIESFDKKLHEAHYQQTQERLSLQAEVKQLKALNHQLSHDALNLTQALKGKNKQQGIWGEIVLSRVLEKSGLAQGREYELQVTSNDAEGKVYRPDAIIHLPQERDVIIDAKVSLTAYLRYQEAEDDISREAAIRDHLLSIRNHIRNLGSKEYHKIVGIQSLDFVLLFLPIESALVCALAKENSLFDEALAVNVILVTPTTLLTTLRTINIMWRVEQQNKNAIEIANQAGNLYDKFVSFIDDLNDIGFKLDAAQKSHQNALNKLSSGRGNLVTRVEGLKKLGAKASKTLLIETQEHEL